MKKSESEWPRGVALRQKLRAQPRALSPPPLARLPKERRPPGTCVSGLLPSGPVSAVVLGSCLWGRVHSSERE